LPHTDGADLGPLAPAAGPLGRLVQLGAALRACAGPCVTPFGTPLGVADGEENYDNRPWRDPDGYARRIRLFTVAGRHTLVDVPPGELRNPDGGRIAGWVYPLEAH